MKFIVNKIDKQKIKPIKKTAFLAFIAGVCLFFLPLSVWAKDKQVIRVDFTELKGYNQIDENGELSGYTYDYLQEIAQYTGWEYEFVQSGGDVNESMTKALTMLEEGELDIIGGMIYSELLAEQYSYTSYNYGTTYTTLCVLENNTKINENNYYNYKDMRVGVMAGNSQRKAEFESFARANNLQVIRVEFSSGLELVEALYSGKVDAMVNVDSSVGEGLRTVVKFSPRPFYFASTNGNQEIINELNAAILKINESNPTFSTELFNEYFVNKSNEIQLSDEENEYIKNAGTLRVAIAPDRAPIQYYDTDEKEYRGVGIDVLDHISQRTGMKFEYVQTNSLEHLKEVLLNGEADMVAGIDYNYMLPKEYNLSLTTPYMDSQIVILANRQEKAEKLDSSRLALTENVLFIDTENTETIWYDSFEECIKAVNSGEAGYTYSDGVIAQYYTARVNYSNISLIPQITESHQTCIGVAKPLDKTLLSIINKAIANMTDSELQAIIYKNTFQPQKITLLNVIESNPKESIMLLILISFLVIGALLKYLNIKLKESRKIDLDNERYRQLCDVSGEFLFEYDYVKDKLVLSDKNVEVFGGERVKEHYFDEMRKKSEAGEQGLDEMIKNNLVNPQDGSTDVQCTLLSGECRWFRITSKVIWNFEGKPIYVVGKLADIQEEKEEKDDLIEKAQTDSLTDIYNAAAGRRLATEFLTEQAGVMVLIDIDRFKEINDRFGHYTGDEVLIAIAAILKRVFRKEDIVSRIGGDEFMVFMKKIQDQEIVADKCRALAKGIKEDINVLKEFPLTLSIGAAMASKKQDYNELYKKADEALYIVKNSGRNGFKIFNP